MRNLILFFTAILLGTTATFATTADDKVAERNAYRYNNSFIFVENGVTFSVYPDGEFDFYIENRIRNRRRNVTFNSGFDYSPFAQYDDYGAVIQVENVPVFYDYYGRVSQIGDVDIRYRNGRVRGIGNMNVFYNNRGFYSYHTGYINTFNRFYVYRPFHGFFARPALGFCFVNTRPYRRFYSPIRYTFHNPYRFNRRNTFARIGREHRYNRVRRERARVYRNDKRVAIRDNSIRNNRTVARNNTSNRTVRNVTRTNPNARTNKTVLRSNRNVANRTVTKREVVRTPRATTVKRSTSTTVRKPVNTNRTVKSASNRVQRSVAKPTQRNSRSTAVSKRSSSARSYKKTPARSSRSTVTRSTTSSSVRKSPARSTRSNRSATNTRSRGRQ